MRLLFSTSYAMYFDIPPGRYGDHEVEVAARSSDWGLDGFRKYPHYLGEAIRLCRQAREYDAVALFSAGMEAFLLGKLLSLTQCKTRVICADFLIPRPSRMLGWVADGLRRINGFVCIRKGDIETLGRRFGIPPRACSFAPFPCSPAATQWKPREGGYIYSAGWAHRDWPTLLKALEQTGDRAVLSMGGDPMPSTSPRIHILPQRSPESGRKLMANASLVVLPLRETELPSGPIVLLDAMAMGKAVIVTNVNGSRDYVVHGETAWMVPPGDDREMARAIAWLMGSPKLRRCLGCAARETVLRQFAPERFIHAVIEACTLK